jgi:death-on-curing protein
MRCGYILTLWNVLRSGRLHYRLTLADALSAHERALKFGGLDGIPNPGLVESAINRPYSGYHRKIEQKAAALVESMAGNHGFADGNKRTTLILLHTLLTKSGYALKSLKNDEDIQDAAESIILDSVTKVMSFDDLVEWFREHIRRAR